MCNGYPAKDPTPPEQKLVRLMEKSMNVKIEPHVMRLFLLAEWKRVTAYAHAVHDAAEVDRG